MHLGGKVTATPEKGAVRFLRVNFAHKRVITVAKIGVSSMVLVDWGVRAYVVHLGVAGAPIMGVQL